MEKKLKIRQRDDFDINKIISEADFLGSGASKLAYAYCGDCYKIPQGADEFFSGCFATTMDFPYEMEDFQTFVDTVAENHEGLVWSLGQFAIELMVWEHLKELEKKGYDISGFARIKDYFFDKNGILVIIQELVEHSPNTKLEGYKCDIFKDENKKQLDALTDMGFEVSDLSSWNLDYNDDLKVKCFDFGLSKNNILYEYDTYEDYCSYSGSYNSYYENEEY